MQYFDITNFFFSIYNLLVPDHYQEQTTVVQNNSNIEIEEAVIRNNNSTTATSVVVTGTTSNCQPIIIQMAPAHPQNVIQQASSFFHHHPTTIPTMIPLQTATIRPLGAPVSVMPPNKLPLPRNTSTSATGKLCGCKQENLMNGVLKTKLL